MIEHKMVNGRQAHLVYLNSDFEPADSDEEAALVKVIFDDDGETVWLVGKGAEKQDEPEDDEEEEDDDT